MIEARVPLHMSRWSRNERLYRYLLGLGLVVEPIFEDSDRTRINHMLVGTEFPLAKASIAESVPEHAAMAGVILPIQRSEIRDGVKAAEPRGDGVVVEFPSVF